MQSYLDTGRQEKNDTAEFCLWTRKLHAFKRKEKKIHAGDSNRSFSINSWKKKKYKKMSRSVLMCDDKKKILKFLI